MSHPKTEIRSYIPVNTPLFRGNEKKYLNECIDMGWISSEGAFVKKFEEAFSQYSNRKYGIAVANGSAALDIAVKAAGIGQGDEVIMPTFTIISPAFSVMRVGATPVYIDSEEDTWNMYAEDIERKITEKTKAIIVVHIYGLPANMERVMEIARKHELIVIEDAAEMHGQTCNGQRCGSFGDISTFSFYANKVITTGEGGMVVCNDEKIAEKCRQYRNLSFVPDKRRFIHYETGWNYRMTNMQAAVGLAQLEQITDFIEKKRAIGAFYRRELAFLTDHGFQLPLKSTDYAENIYWVFGLIAPDEAEKERVIRYLEDHAIGTRPFFWCMHEQPLYADSLVASQHFPVAEKMARRGFYIPSGLGIKEEEMQIVVSAFRQLYG
ncbi:MAG TPA: DegT/DnrJ/EryC1/StrS family aminotransferase [Flavipsychrobacter sp.]|nr:DegT/DnrJ/EryC1/StrS family aminotransferase [Flavipsychrobacter sp.]